MTDWKVGDKAVCIRNDYWYSYKGERPVVGNIYTVKAVFIGTIEATQKKEVSLRLVELAPLINTGGYPAKDFRKVVKDEAKSKKSICNQLDELFNQKADA